MGLKKYRAVCQHGPAAAATAGPNRGEALRTMMEEAVVFLTQTRTSLDIFLHHVRAKYVISAKDPASPPRSQGDPTIPSAASAVSIGW